MMQAELISVGTELLLGQTLNTNVKFLAEQLASLGINIYFQTTVGDNRERLLQALRIATGRADLIILTGGLGPTEDDLTKETLAEFLQLPLEIVPAELEQIKSLFKRSDFNWTKNNDKQAAFIPGSSILKNEIGSAPGMALKNGKQGYLILPGPPREMTRMFLQYAQPWIKEIFQDELQGILYSTVLKFMGITESGLEVLLADLLHQQKEVTLALYAKTGEIQLRITTRAQNRKDFAQKITPVFNEIKKRTTAYFFAQDDVTITDVVAQLLLKKNFTLSTAESCTGGMLAESLTAVPGSSAYYLGSIVSYANSVKARLLGVPQDLLEKHGAVSREVGMAMAQQIRVLTGSDLGIGITGIAGPEGGSPEKPVGLVYIALATPDTTICTECHFMGDREIIRRRSVLRAYYLIWQYLQNTL
ncbi:MAG TPA: competence/damage-inducible protein A [Clostridia bacterium]|jgi:nicotinamide-nucleotide amidase|nr:competence/damage-inducible protein A [Clostridia bacterium]